MDDAKLNLSYTVITSPADGMVSKVNVQVGQFLSAGQSTFSVVLDQNLWVIANFKETQYSKIKSRTTGRSLKWMPFRVMNLKAPLLLFHRQPVPRFALLPPDNASGNFVKVVQRLPVKIEFSNPQDSVLSRLKAGMNVNVDVHIGK